MSVRLNLLSFLLLAFEGHRQVSAFHTFTSADRSSISTTSTQLLHGTAGGDNEALTSETVTSSRRRDMFQSLVVASVGALAGTASFGVNGAFADDIGVEKEAPTLFTGENVMICKKRGPLGACLETQVRTEENDNDKAKRYFRDPSAIIQQQQEQKARMQAGDEGNALIEKLRKQSVENQEKNDLYVQQKTFENDQSATFGPFDRQVLIMNTDGKTFTLLANPQAMRLKKAGFIQDRKFIKQPTEEEIQQAMADSEGGGLADAVLGVFGGGSK